MTYSNNTCLAESFRYPREREIMQTLLMLEELREIPLWKEFSRVELTRIRIGKH